MSDKDKPDKPDKPPKPDKLRGIGAARIIGEDGRVATGASVRSGTNLRRSGQQGGRAAVGPESPIQDTGQPPRPPR